MADHNHRDDHFDELAAYPIITTADRQSASRLFAAVVENCSCTSALIRRTARTHGGITAVFMTAGAFHVTLQSLDPVAADMVPQRIQDRFRAMKPASVAEQILDFKSMTFPQRERLLRDAADIWVALARKAHEDTGKPVTADTIMDMVASYARVITLERTMDHQYEAEARLMLGALEVLQADPTLHERLPGGPRFEGGGWHAHAIGASAALMAHTIEFFTEGVQLTARNNYMHQVALAFAAAVSGEDEGGPDRHAVAAGLLRMLADRIDPRATTPSAGPPSAPAAGDTGSA
jgi:hypothetical protein